jgi:hypothetical protein
MSAAIRGPVGLNGDQVRPMATRRHAHHDIDSIAESVERLVALQKGLQAELRQLADLAGEGRWREELVIAAEKCEAARFWACEGIRRIEQLRGRRLVPDNA